MIEFLKFSEIVVCILLSFIILIQNKNVSLDLANMSGGMGAITKRGPEKVLHNITIILGVLFILNSLILAVL